WRARACDRLSVLPSLRPLLRHRHHRHRRDRGHRGHQLGLRWRRRRTLLAGRNGGAPLLPVPQVEARLLLRACGDAPRDALALGGVGTVIGPLLGALVLVPLSEATRVLLGGSGRSLDLVVYGLLIMLISVFEPAGIAGIARRLGLTAR